MQFINLIKNKLIGFILVLTLMFMVIGSTFKYVDASAGDYNKSVLLDNIYYNNVLSEATLDTGDILYGSGYNYSFTDTFVASKNLFDKDSVQLDRRINGLGEIYVSVGKFVTGYIPVIAGFNYTYNEGLGTSQQLSFFDSSFNFISNHSSSVGVNTVLAPINASFMINSNEISDIDIFQIELGNTATSYEAYLPADDLYTQRFGRDYNDVLQGLSYSLEASGSTMRRFSAGAVNISNLPVYLGVDEAVGIIAIDNTEYTPLSTNDISTDSTPFTFSIASTTIRIVDDSIDLTEFNSKISSGVDFIYELDTYLDRFYEYTYINYIGIDELPYLYNLTYLFGEGLEPTGEEFAVILENAPDYFDTYTVNYYEDNDDIGEFSCLRTATNLIDNGDFNDLTLKWYGVAGISDIDISSNYLSYQTTTSNSVIQYSTFTVPLGNVVYYNFDYKITSTDIYNIDVYLRNGLSDGFDNSFLPVMNNEWNNFSGYSIVDDGDGGSLAIRVQSVDGLDIINIDNVMVFDLTAIYGNNNEPSLEEFELILDNNITDYSEEFYYDDTCYMTVDQNNPVYQYEDYVDTAYNAEVNLVMTSTILEQNHINPNVYIAKYDLEMNYLGDLYEGLLTDDGVNAEGYEYFNMDFVLPDTISSETGYIYIVYDKKGVGANVIASGYVFKQVGASFTQNNVNNAIGINNSPYVLYQGEPLFINDVDDVMFNTVDNTAIVHIKAKLSSFEETDVNFYSENTDQIKTLDYETELYQKYSKQINNKGVPNLYTEGVFYISEGSNLPSLLTFLNSIEVASPYLREVLSDYNNDMINFFYDVGYADNKGVYSYNLKFDTTVLAKGETPLFYFDTFHIIDLASASIRTGRSLLLEIIKDNIYINEVYDIEYLYDNNTGIYEYDINSTSVNQVISMEVFDGFTPDNATVYYHLQKTDLFKNGADEDYYDIYLSLDYTVTQAVPFAVTVDNGLGLIGLNSVLGKVLASVVLLVLITIGMYFFSKSIIAVLFVDVITIILLTILGFIPLWIILVIIMLLFGGLFIQNKRSGE